MSIQNTKDFISVLLGKVHNIGAGGVNSNGFTDRSVMNRKRINQHCRRISRAIGLPK